jgi:hypothetical protein
VPALVRVNEQGEYVRRPARMNALPFKSHQILRRLADTRLLIIREECLRRLLRRIPMEGSYSAEGQSPDGSEPFSCAIPCRPSAASA